MLRPEPRGSMRRRNFLGVLGGAAAWPLAARAQHSDRVRRIGVLIGYFEDDPETKASLRTASAFLPAISSLGGFRTPAPSRRVRRAVRHRPASENLHNSGQNVAVPRMSALCQRTKSL